MTFNVICEYKGILNFIRHTRTLLNAALDGKLLDVPYETDPVFGFQVPKRCEGVPDSVLDPASSWSSRELYDDAYRQLAARFIERGSA